MRKLAKTILCCLPFLGTACSSSNDIVTTTVPQLDLEKYVGKWYEVARFDHRFERDLVGCTANYSVNDDGTIKVVNAGYKESFAGNYKESEGKARRPDENVPGQLEVSFFAWFYSEYNVMELADDYRYALVGSKTDNYLWILSRTPQLDPADKEFLLRQATARGYDTDALIWVPQKTE
ncbi:MAG: lipocalin family protein [Bacteroidales bacterium]|nr:lipocalin family protein [Bacteroidales bacterium]